jgi:hypothetical protein
MNQRPRKNQRSRLQALPLVATLLSVWIGGGTALLWACNIPVFQYAMAYWEPDPFPVVVLHRGPLTDEQQSEVDWLRNKGEDAVEPANVEVILVDLDQPLEDRVQPLLAGMREPDTLPWIHVAYPASSRLPQPAFSAAWQPGLAQGLVTSPAREEVLSRLADGHSAVWIMISSSDSEADAKAEALIQVELPRVTDRLLSSGQVAGRDHGAGSSGLLLGEAPEVELDLPEAPLQFSVMTVDRNDPAEQPFVSMLLNSESDLHEFDDPIVIPVFGRGRSYFALVGAGITAENLFELSAFLVGSCSCEVKAENPGTDLLFAANWSEMVQLMPEDDRPLPALTGLGAFESGELRSARSLSEQQGADADEVDADGERGERLASRSASGQGADQGTESSEIGSSGAERSSSTAGASSGSEGLSLTVRLAGILLVIVALVAIGTVSFVRRPAI